MADLDSGDRDEIISPFNEQRKHTSSLWRRFDAYISLQQRSVSESVQNQPDRMSLRSILREETLKSIARFNQFFELLTPSTLYISRLKITPFPPYQQRKLPVPTERYQWDATSFRLTVDKIFTRGGGAGGGGGGDERWEIGREKEERGGKRGSKWKLEGRKTWTKQAALLFDDFGELHPGQDEDLKRDFET